MLQSSVTATARLIQLVRRPSQSLTRPRPRPSAMRAVHVNKHEFFIFILRRCDACLSRSGSCEGASIYYVCTEMGSQKGCFCPLPNVYKVGGSKTADIVYERSPIVSCAAPGLPSNGPNLALAISRRERVRGREGAIFTNLDIHRSKEWRNFGPSVVRGLASSPRPPH